jgi:acyl-coenzyme A synthetase/AMP-(fatty) acid ligase
MFAKSVKIARFLSSIGLKQHDVVAIYGSCSVNFTPLLFACFVLGLPVLTISRLNAEDQISNSLSRVKPKLLVFNADYKSTIDEMPLETVKLITLKQKLENIDFIDKIIEKADKEVGNYE